MTDDATPRILQAIQDRLNVIERKIDEHAASNAHITTNLARSVLELRRVLENHAADLSIMVQVATDTATRVGSLEHGLRDV